MPTKSVNVQTHLNGIVEELMCNGGQMQDKYILPPDQRPQMSEVCFSSESIPVVDLKELDGPNRRRVVEEIRRACEEGGFFQIVNHDVPVTAMKSMMEIAKEFFEMPVEDRAYLYSEDTNKLVRVSTSFNNHKETVLNWRDYLIHSCHPLEDVIGCWPEKPAAYRDIAGNYATEVRALILRLLAAISEALGLASDYLNRIFRKHDQWMAINYYPACPNPDLTLGIPGHSDVRGITVLMQGDVSGLQVIKEGKWVAVEPIPNAFVVNLGVQMEAVSNGRFRSALHRAVTNGSTARISIPTFYGPSYDAFLSPAASMVDEQHPALYREYKVGEFMGMFWNNKISSKSVLDYYKIEHPENNGE
jgi:isopenicillin N synthase-like dioxygenase